MAASKRPHTLESKESNCQLKIAQARPNDGLHRPYNRYYECAVDCDFHTK